MPRTLLVALILFVSQLSLLVCERALAQTLPVGLRVSREYALSLQNSQLQLPARLVAQSELHRKTRRGRALVITGSTLLISGIAHAAAFGYRGVCYGSEERLKAPAIAGGLVAAGGFTMVLRGGFVLAGVPEDYRKGHPPSIGKRIKAAAGVFGLLVLTQAALFGISASASQYIDCISS